MLLVRPWSQMPPPTCSTAAAATPTAPAVRPAEMRRGAQVRLSAFMETPRDRKVRGSEWRVQRARGPAGGCFTDGRDVGTGAFTAPPRDRKLRGSEWKVHGP